MYRPEFLRCDVTTLTGHPATATSVRSKAALGICQAALWYSDKSRDQNKETFLSYKVGS